MCSHSICPTVAIKSAHCFLSLHPLDTHSSRSGRHGCSLPGRHVRHRYQHQRSGSSHKSPLLIPPPGPTTLSLSSFCVVTRLVDSAFAISEDAFLLRARVEPLSSPIAPFPGEGRRTFNAPYLYALTDYNREPHTGS